MAVGLPGSRFLGIDLEAAPIERGRALIAAAGLLDLRTHPLARIQFAAGTRGTNLLHGTVEMEAAGARRIVCGLDGTQTKRSLERLFAEAPGGLEATLGQLYRHGLLLY